QKQLFEILILLIGLISGKLIIETIDYVKESRVKNLKETFNLILDYDEKIEMLLDRIEHIDNRKKKDVTIEKLGKLLIESLNIIKILLLIETIERIVENSFGDKNHKMFQIHIEHIYTKVQFSLWFKKYLVRDPNGNIVFEGSIKKRMQSQGDNGELIEKFLKKCNSITQNFQ
ncbi:MAG: hypothetical protein Q8K26_00125, partial [Candidatus Gracilibacteria bacterium]|nr:hypothetical protein [Candidatus Gracilibacteria bacterium]